MIHRRRKLLPFHLWLTMTLKINLAPGECVVIGKARVENGGDRRCTLIVTGSETILREKRILRERDATTPLKRLYFVVQSIYLADDKEQLYDLYHAVAREAVQAWPHLLLDITDVGTEILAGNDYGALNKAHALVESEQQLLDAEKEAKK